jgi:hypothetical protein
LAIIIWHMYHVHVRRFNRSIFTGHLKEDEMIEEHPLELADIKAGLAERPVDPKAVAHRRRIFLPLYAVVAVLLLAGVYAFVTFEQTAITTLPEPVDLPVFAPLTATPLPTRAATATRAASPSSAPSPTSVAGATLAPPTVTTTWLDVEPMIVPQCGTCHGAGGGMAGLDLTGYAGLLQGGVSGPAIVPGDAGTSLLVQRQQTGDHPGQLGPEALGRVIAWIEAGAPEN